MSKWIDLETDASTGNPYLWKCDECGEEVETKWNYCPECGDPKTSKGKSINTLVKALETEHKRLREMQSATDKNVGTNDTINRQQAIDALAEDMPRPYTPDGSHPADEGIFMAQEIYADCIQTLKELPSAQPERTCVNCGRTANNGGWYADGKTRCPIEEHYALPKDGYCHLWEKRNVIDDDYPERREE